MQLQKEVTDILNGYSNVLRFWLNGREIKIVNPDPTDLLVNFLHLQGLTGTKVGCEQGGCGACTVMISRKTKDGLDHKAINSCLRPLVGLDGVEVTTVEGIGNLHDGLDPVQHRIAVFNGTQCGFCTPGFVMNMHSYLQQHQTVTEQQVEDLFGGNLCRCTGYRPILHGMRTFACDYNPHKDQTPPCALDPFYELKVREKAIEIDGQKLPAPGEHQNLHFSSDKIHWVRPTRFEEVHALKTLLADEVGPEQVKVIVGNTASGIYPNEKPKYVIDISHIEELNELSESEDGITVGAAVAIQDLMDFSEKLIKKLPAQKTEGLRQLVAHAKCIAGIQVRNAGSVAGNIFITKSHTKSGHPFPSDLFTVLSALGASVTVSSKKFTGHEKSFSVLQMPIAEELPTDAVLKSFEIPFTREREYVRTYRIARRPQMAHAVVNAGFRCLLDEQNKVKEISLIYGGLTTCNGELPETEKLLKGKVWNEATLEAAVEHLRQEVKGIIVPMEEEGFTIQYRSQLAQNFFYKFFLAVLEKIDPKAVSEVNASAGVQQIRPLSAYSGETGRRFRWKVGDVEGQVFASERSDAGIYTTYPF